MHLLSDLNILWDMPKVYFIVCHTAHGLGHIQTTRVHCLRQFIKEENTFLLVISKCISFPLDVTSFLNVNKTSVTPLCLPLF